MQTAVVALTKKATLLAAGLAKGIGADLHVQEKHQHLLAVPMGQTPTFEQVENSVTAYQLPLERHTEQLFAQYQGIVFVMASGIVVRCIAPLLRSKLVDPAVVVVDERGCHAISLLSGHLGGANELAQQVAAAIGARAVITTATDVNGLIAADVLARRNCCTIDNPDLIKVLNTALLEGQTLALFTPFSVVGESPLGFNINPVACLDHNIVLDNRRSFRVPGTTLYLRPRQLVLGIGCRRGTSLAQIRDALAALLEQHDLCESSIAKLASIDLKADEAGILALAKQLQLPFLTFSAELLSQVQGVTTHSALVQRVTGTGNVCEAAALLAAGADGRLLVPKTICPGITLALAAEDYHVVL